MLRELFGNFAGSEDSGSGSFLLLFDIDGTLVDTGGKGMGALQEATRLVFGEVGPPLDLAGATDLGLIGGFFEHFGRDFCEETAWRFFEIYHDLLEEKLQADPYVGGVLDGAERFLEAVSASGCFCCGLLTGNTERGALIKMRHYGLHHHFSFGAYGSDHADRNRLGPIALERALAVTGRVFSPQRTLVIGDTPKDIACARAMGARCLAVATGQFSADELRRYGADRVEDSLAGFESWMSAEGSELA